MNFTDLLKKHQLKVTPQRLTLLEQTYKYGHIDIDTLFENIKLSFPSISLATLYKNINSMVEKSLLKELKIVGMKNKYEISKNEHAHTICEKCGRVDDIYLQTDTLKEKLQENTKYCIVKSDMNFFGICPDCQNI